MPSILSCPEVPPDEKPRARQAIVHREVLSSGPLNLPFMGKKCCVDLNYLRTTGEIQIMFGMAHEKQGTRHLRE